MMLEISISVLIADSLPELQAAISMKKHLLCLKGYPQYLSFTKEEQRGNKFFTIVSYENN